MVIYASQKNRVATSRWQIGFRFGAFDHDHILKISFFDFGTHRFEFAFVNLSRKDFSRRANIFCGHEGKSSVARSDVRDDCSFFPLH